MAVSVLSPAPWLSICCFFKGTSLCPKHISWRPERRAKMSIAAAVFDESRNGKLDVLIGKMSNPSLSLHFGEEFMRLIANASSAPIAQYIASPITPLHTLDPRVKQAWLLALVFFPSRSPMTVRLGIMGFLLIVTTWFLPRRMWQDQLSRMALFSGLLFLMVSLGTDGVPPIVQTRTPPAALCSLPELPLKLENYSYVIWKIGPLQLTRKGLMLGITAACMSLTVLQSASLCLATTMPEHLAAGLRWYLTPFAFLGAPVDELVLTLLLSLRFIGLVFDEVRNIALGVVSRGIEWKKLTLSETADVLFMFFGRIFKNLFNHAEQIAQAMVARGYRANPATHKIYLSKFSIRTQDFVAILMLVVLIGAGLFLEPSLN